MIEREVRVLFRKELQQLFSGKSALATGAILPLLMLGVVPTVLALATHASGEPDRPVPESMRIGFIGDVATDPHHLAGAILPLFVAVVGMVLPTMMASYLLVTERERRTLELLVALPVRIEQVLLAKLLATLAASCAIAVPMLLLDMIVLPLVGAASFAQVVALPILLGAGLTLSTSVALLMALLAKDFRTANNVAGAAIAPTLIGTWVLGILLPGGIARPLGIGLIYLVIAAFLFRRALKTITFEGLLS
ncbi:MAG: ABC transporter permease [Sandaracinus sp.]